MRVENYLRVENYMRLEKLLEARKCSDALTEGSDEASTQALTETCEPRLVN